MIHYVQIQRPTNVAFFACCTITASSRNDIWDKDDAADELGEDGDVDDGREVPR
jgi:hypothetical protein